MGWRLAWPAGLAALGALQTLAFVHTTLLWWLPIVGVAVLVRRLDGATPRQAALLGWAYGFGWLCGGVWWLFISLHEFGGLPAPLAVAAVLLLSAALSLYLAAAAAAYAAWRSRRLPSDALLFAAVWLLAEWARGVIFTGFPWLASGYAQVDASFAAALPWVGVYGVGVMVAIAGVLLSRLVAAAPAPRGQRGAAAVALIGLLLAPLALRAIDFSHSTGKLRVTLIQTGISQDEKFAVERMPAALVWLSKTLHESSAELVVAPETAVPLLPHQLSDFAPGWWEALVAHFNQPGRAALIGLPLGTKQYPQADDLRRPPPEGDEQSGKATFAHEAGYTNSVLGLGGSAAMGATTAAVAAPAYRYDKYHLVPFGEFVPPGFRWFIDMMNIPLGDFSRGPVDAPSFAVGAASAQRLAPNICYEDLFGEDLAVRFVRAEQAPTILANVSNIGWFGDTVAIPQHLNISRVRTLELQRPMLRATNTGATAIVDHRGRVTMQLVPFVRGVLEGEVEGRNGITPYAWWAGRFGLWPLVLLALVVLVAARLSARRARHAPDAPAAPR